jgi:hypothetical protein
VYLLLGLPPALYLSGFVAVWMLLSGNLQQESIFAYTSAETCLIARLPVRLIYLKRQSENLDGAGTIVMIHG